MKLSDTVSRQPDLQIILEASAARFRPTYMDGPADIVIEIISPESIGRDHGTKYQEYEAYGVPEFWIIDPLHAECRFYRLSGERYVLKAEGEDGYYMTPRLPEFRLHVPTLWRPVLPNGLEIVKAVEAMVADRR